MDILLKRQVLLGVWYYEHGAPVGTTSEGCVHEHPWCEVENRQFMFGTAGVGSEISSGIVMFLSLIMEVLIEFSESWAVQILV